MSQKQKTQTELLEEMNDKLNKVIKLLAIQSIGDKDYRDQVTLLDSMGLQAKDIAELTGKTTNNVKVTLDSFEILSKPTLTISPIQEVEA